MTANDLALDPDSWDLDTKNGDLYFAGAENSTGIIQYLRQKLSLYLTEWFLDQSRGVPYHDEVFVKNPDRAVLDTIFKDEILSTPGMVELTSFDLTLDGETRRGKLTFEGRSVEGEISFSEELPLLVA